MQFDPLHLTIPAEPRQLSGVRAALGDWLRRARVSHQDRDGMVLAANEAVANGIEHSSGDGELRIRGEIDDHGVTVTVTSPGPWLEPEVRLGGGNGLLIIRRLTEVQINTTDTRADVRMRRRLSTPV